MKWAAVNNNNKKVQFSEKGRCEARWGLRLERQRQENHHKVQASLAGQQSKSSPARVAEQDSLKQKKENAQVTHSFRIELLW